MILQKTFVNDDIEALDNQVNKFIQSEEQIVTATQSYGYILNGIPRHTRVLFYMNKRINKE